MWTPPPITEETWLAIEDAAERASIANPDSPNRKRLRKLLCENDIAIAAIVLRRSRRARACRAEMTVLVVIARDAHGTVTVVGVYQDIEMARRAAEDRAPWAYIVPSHLLTSRHDALREREDAS